MREIPLTRDKVALIDDEDYERVTQFKWHAQKRGDDKGWYAAAQPPRPAPKVRLHRFIMNAAEGTLVDHKDGDGLNCQRHNMRLTTPRGNVRNSRKPITNTSGYKGARCLNGRYYAYITIDGKPKHFGGFASIEDAARGYDELARKHYGEFANLNFPNA